MIEQEQYNTFKQERDLNLARRSGYGDAPFGVPPVTAPEPEQVRLEAEIFYNIGSMATYGASVFGMCQIPR